MAYVRQSPASTSGTKGWRPQPTSQAYVHTAGKPDKGGIATARMHYTSSYFYNPKTADDLDPSFFEMRQNDIVFIVQNPHAPQTPLFRTVLNGIDYSKEAKDIIDMIEDNLTSFNEKTRNDLVREIVSKKIFPVGVVKGDGVTYGAGDHAAIAMTKHDRFVVDSAGTVSMKVKSENLGLGMLAEIKVPTRKEWMSSEHYGSGNITLFCDPVENRTIHDRLSEIFWKFNVFEHPDLAELIHKTSTNAKKRADLPASLKLVTSFVKMMKQISCLTIQKAYSSQMIEPLDKTKLQFDEVCFNYPMREPYTPGRDPLGEPGFVIDKLIDRFDGGGRGNGQIAANVSKFVDIYKSMRNEGDGHSKLSYAPVATPDIDRLDISEKIFNNLYNPELYKKDLLLRHYKSTFFESSLNILTFTFFLSNIANPDNLHLSGVRKKNEFDRFYLSMSSDQLEVEHKLYENNYNDMYHFLIHDFLPHVEASYYQLGNQQTRDGQPMVNTFCYEKVLSAETSLPSKTDYMMNYHRDVTRSNQQIHECFSDFLMKIIQWSKDMNHGLKMRVTEPGGHLEAASLYVR